MLWTRNINVLVPRYGIGLVDNVKLTRVSKKSQLVVGVHTVHNTVSSVSLLVDLIDGTSSDHLASGSDFVIKNSGGTPVKTITSMDGGYPVAATAGTQTVTGGWADETADTYDPHTAEWKSPAGTVVLTASVTSWPNKPASENWYFEWDLAISEGGDGNFHENGLDHLINLVIGNQTEHFDANDWRIEVWDGDPDISGVKQGTLSGATHSQPTSSSIRNVWTRAAGGGTWSWNWVRSIILDGAGQSTFYDDDITNVTQTSDVSAQYTFTLSFS